MFRTSQSFTLVPRKRGRKGSSESCGYNNNRKEEEEKEKKEW